MSKLTCVFLIEDDPISTFITLKAIKAQDICSEIKVSTNGNEAFEFLKLKIQNKEPAPELIFLDINLPKMDGFEFFKQYKDLPLTFTKETIVCILTNSNHPDDIKKFTSPEIQEYLIKPLSREKVEHVYRKYFN